MNQNESDRWMQLEQVRQWFRFSAFHTALKGMLSEILTLESIPPEVKQVILKIDEREREAYTDILLAFEKRNPGLAAELDAGRSEGIANGEG